MADEEPAVEEMSEPREPKASVAPDAVAELEAARRESQELLSKLKYAQAELENVRKRAAKDTESLARLAQEALLLRLLPVLDEIDAADTNLPEELGRGVRMVHDNLRKAFADAGLQEILAVGLPFDPYVHECVERVPLDGTPDDTVTAVVRKGYRLHDRILRPAQVIVVKNGGEASG